ncbi:MAG: hypothetical protein CMP25_01935 [Rickettsiales bacterium]|nr:hypothetical protein [Rickettsiales bacterium]
MTPYNGPTFEHYLIVMGFLTVLIVAFYFFKKNKHIITNKFNNQKRMRVSEVTVLGHGDRALILKLDDKDFLFISGKNSGALLTEIKSPKNLQKENSENILNQEANLKTTEIKNLIEKRIRNDQKI